MVGRNRLATLRAISDRLPDGLFVPDESYVIHSGRRAGLIMENTVCACLGVPDLAREGVAEAVAELLNGAREMLEVLEELKQQAEEDRCRE